MTIRPFSEIKVFSFLDGFLKRSHDFKRITVNSLWITADRVFRLIIGFFITIYLAKYLGPENYGKFNYAIAFVFLFTFLSKLGLDNIVIRDLVKKDFAEPVIVGTTFYLKLFGSILLFLASLTVIFYVEPGSPEMFFLVFFVALSQVFLSLDCIDYFFQSRVEAKNTVTSKFIGFLLGKALVLVLIWQKASLVSFGFAYFIQISSGALVLASKYMRRSGITYLKSFSHFYAKKALSESWPLILSSIAVVLYMRIDQVMLAKMVDLKAVGSYSVAVQISELWYFFPVAIISSFFPSIVSLRQINNALYLRRLNILFSLMVVISFCYALPVSILSKNIIAVTFGARFLSGAQALSILAWSGVFVFLGVTQGSWIVSEGLTHLALYKTFSGAVCNILLNFILIPLYAETGAAWSTLLSYAVSGYFFNILFKETRPIFIIQTRALLFLDLKKFLYLKN